MPLKPLPFYPAGGVDSRSNPLVMPGNRYLHVHDFWPQQDGSFRLRDGYVLLAEGLRPGVPIHSVVSVTGPIQESNVNTTTTAAIIATGAQSVTAATTAGMVIGAEVQIDTGTNAEPVTITAIYLPYKSGFTYHPGGFAAVFSKTHAANVPVVGINGQVPPLVVFWQGTTPYILNQLTNAVTSPIVKGAAIQSSSRFSYFYTNGHLHAFNGTDAKWFDGIYWRDIGLPTLTAAQAAAITYAVGLEAMTVTQAAGVGMTFASGGGWTVDAGDQFSFAFFDTATNTLAASVLLLNAGAVMVGTANQKLNFTGLPTNSVATVLGILSIITPSNAGAVFLYDSTVGEDGLLIVSASSYVGTTVTLTITGHGLSSGQVIVLDGAAGSADMPSFGPFAVTVVDANHISFQTAAASLYGNNLSNGTALKLLTVANGTTSATLNYNTTWVAVQGVSFNAAGQNLLPYANDTTQIYGLAGSTIGGSQPGYQFYACIYNIVTGHVGNRTMLGFRLDNPATVASIVFSGCPIFADSEWTLLLGRTSDGAEIPYAIIDNYANWLFVPNGQATYTLYPYSIDGSSELPSRNYPPPGTLDANYQLSLLPGGSQVNPPINGTFVCVEQESDHSCGSLAGSATVYRSGSAQDMREGQFVGLPEQSWDPADIETFPTGNPIVSMHSYQQESWCYTKQDCAVLMELAGETQWQGPFNVGASGQHAWTRGWNNLPFWVTGNKELATVSLGGYQQLAGTTSTVGGGPIIISDEYEAALLSKIGSAYLSQVEVVYIRIPLKRVEVLRINCLDVNGNPFTIIHDFNLRDERSAYGQGYEEDLTGSLTNSSTTTGSTVGSLGIPLSVVLGTTQGLSVGSQIIFEPGTSNQETVTVNAIITEPIGITSVFTKQHAQGVTVFLVPAGFTMAAIRDENEISQVVAGGSDGNLYELYSGGNDNGVEFTAQALALVNAGEDRTALKKMEWWGDSEVHWFISKKLDIPFDVMQMDDLCADPPDLVQGEEHNSHWQVDVQEPEITNAYVMLQLTSHSADGTTALNVPPHIPLETYGRVWVVEPLAGTSRGR